MRQLQMTRSRQSLCEREDADYADDISLNDDSSGGGGKGSFKDDRIMEATEDAQTTMTTDDAVCMRKWWLTVQPTTIGRQRFFLLFHTKPKLFTRSMQDVFLRHEHSW